MRSDLSKDLDAVLDIPHAFSEILKASELFQNSHLHCFQQF